MEDCLIKFQSSYLWAQRQLGTNKYLPTTLLCYIYSEYLVHGNKLIGEIFFVTLIQFGKKCKVTESCKLSSTRTYTPPTNKLVFGGNGVNTSNSLNMAIDRVNIVPTKDTLKSAYQYLINIDARQKACTDYGFVLTNTLTCYGIFKLPVTLSEAAYDCWYYGEISGFGQNGGRASYPWYNWTEWNITVPKIMSYKNGSIAGYTAWMGPTTGHPPGVNSNVTGYNMYSFLQLTTKTKPWSWFAPKDCSDTAVADGVICKWSCNFARCINEAEFLKKVFIFS